MNSNNIVLLVSITTVSLPHVYSTLHAITQPTGACTLPHLQGADTTDHLMICDRYYQYNPVDKDLVRCFTCMIPQEDVLHNTPSLQKVNTYSWVAVGKHKLVTFLLGITDPINYHNFLSS